MTLCRCTKEQSYCIGQRRIGVTQESLTSRRLFRSRTSTLTLICRLSMIFQLMTMVFTLARLLKTQILGCLDALSTQIKYRKASSLFKSRALASKTVYSMALEGLSCLVSSIGTST